MGIHFGNLARVRHIITYSLSPFEQRALPSVFSDALPNVWRRFSSQVFKVVPRECRGTAPGGRGGAGVSAPALSARSPSSVRGLVPALLVGHPGVREAQEEEPG